MKIRIKENIKEIFDNIQRQEYFMYKKEYGEILERYAGKELSVETDYLFDNQYNVLEDNLRVYEWAVEKVIDDIRLLYKKCNFCGKKNLKTEIKFDRCNYCGEIEYLEDIVGEEKIRRYDFRGIYS